MTNLETTPAPASIPISPRKPALPLLRQTLQIVTLFMLVVASYLAISHFLIQNVRVVGRSMRPTLHDSEHCLLNRWIYRFRSPQRGDIVVLRDPADNGFSVKRIVATPGDSLYMKDGNVYLNGVKLDELYLAPDTPTFSYSTAKEQLILCGKDQFYVLGDNRLNSVDSRTYGAVPRASILGQLIR